MKNTSMERWPNFFIVGAPKSGTSSLYEYLKSIPGIYMSTEKEPNYFSAVSVAKNNLLKPMDKKRYLGLFKNVKNEKIIGEASPNYLADPEAAKLIHQVSPNAKILISLRNPIERVFSNYLMYKGVGRVSGSFREIIENEFKNEFDYGDVRLKLHTGKYYADVKRYLETFGNNNVKIIIFEEFFEAPKNSFNEILKFLHLSYLLDDFENIQHNPHSSINGKFLQTIWSNKNVQNLVKSGIIPMSTRKFLRNKLFLKKQTKPKLPEDARKILEKFYYDDVQKLKNLLGRELPWQGF